MTDDGRYNVNFFKPHSDHSRANNKLIFILASIWAIGVFGFQILLMVLNEPTPEAAHTTYQNVYPAVVEDNAATATMKTDFSKSLLMVLGKNIAVKDEHKLILKQALSWTITSMQPDSMKPVIMAGPTNESLSLAAETLKLEKTGFDKIMIDLLPTSLIPMESIELPAAVKSELPGLMDLYLIHNRNALTDFIFMGFPFHYWYTSQFLLIMFVVLCIIYAISTEKLNTRTHFIEED